MMNIYYKDRLKSLIIVSLASFSLFMIFLFYQKSEKKKVSMSQFFQSEISLSKKQMKQIRQIFKRQKREIRKNSKRIKEFRSRELDAVFNLAYDAKKHQLSLDSIAFFQEKSEMLRFQSFRQIRVLLDEEQRTKYETLLKEILHTKTK